MKTKNMIWAALSMTAALVMTACTNDDNVVDTPAAPQAEVKTIPYTVTVGQGGDATTRATVDSDNKTLRFAAGDKLYILSYNHPGGLKGILTLKAGDEGKTSGATFEGTISYGGNAPADDTPILATLVGTSNVNFDIVDDKVVGGIPSSAYYDNVKEAVEAYSYLTGMSSYGEKEFTLEQIMAFLNFEITFEDGTAAGTTLNTVVSNGGLYPDPYCSANVTTKTEGGKVVAKFVLPVAAGATLSGATVKMGDKAALTIKDATLEGKVYNISRSVAATPVVPDGAISGQFTVNGDGDKVYFSKGNLYYNANATTKWYFATNQWDCISTATATGYPMDHFTWGNINNPTFNGQTYVTGTSDLNGETDWGSRMGTGWRTLSSAEWTYLFNTRTNAASKYGYATVAEKHGIIIVPDDFTDPMKNNGSGAFVGSTTTGWTANVYSAENWSAMETAGCVFLPAAGYRYGNSVGYVEYCYYWSSTAKDAGYAYYAGFSSDNVYPASNTARDMGFLVRLVREVPAGSQGTQANDRSYGEQSNLGTW